MLNLLQTYLISRISGLIFPLSPLFKASQGDVGHAVGLLTTQSAEVLDPGESQESGTSGEAWDGQKGAPEIVFNISKIIYNHIELKVDSRDDTSAWMHKCSRH